jgi:hypothetical protein
MGEDERREVCARHAIFEHGLRDDILELKSGISRIHKRFDDLIAVIHRYDVALAEVKLRVQFLEKVVYGAVGLALTSIGLALIAMVTRG